LIRYLLLAGLLITFQHQTFATVEFSLEINKIHSLWSFATSMSDSYSGNKQYRLLYEHSKFNRAKNQLKLDRFKNIYNKTMSMNFESAQENSFNAEELLIIQTAYASNFSDLESRLSPMLPLDLRSELIQSLKDLLPLFHKLVWTPENVKELEGKKSDFEQVSRRVNLKKLINEMAAFFNIPDNLNLPTIKVILNPLPGDVKGTHSQSIENIQSMGLGYKDGAGDFLGVVVHEISHTLYGTFAPTKIQQQISDLLLTSQDINIGAYFAAYIDEAIATSLGNGVAVELIDKPLFLKEFKKDRAWYNHEVIDRFAKEIFPTLKPALSTKQRLDAKLIKGLQDIFDKTFPESSIEYRNAFIYFTLLYDNVTFSKNQIVSAVRKYFKTKSIHSSDLTTTPHYQTSKAALIIVQNNKHTDNVSTIISDIPVLSPFKDELLSKISNFLFAANDTTNHRLIIIIRADTIEAVDKYLQMLSTNKKIEKDGFL